MVWDGMAAMNAEGDVVWGGDYVARGGDYRHIEQ